VAGVGAQRGQRVRSTGEGMVEKWGRGGKGEVG